MTSTPTNHSRFNLTLTLGATLLAFALVGCATNRSAGDQLSDAAITAKIKTKLAADPEVNPFNIDVDTMDGEVRLTGTVRDDATRREAVKLAGQTRGVHRVINDIELGHETLGEKFDDAVTTSRINAKIAADDELNPLNIDIDTVEGVVTLSGKVASEANRQRAEDLARNTKGVRDVRNRLEIRGGAGG